MIQPPAPPPSVRPLRFDRVAYGAALQAGDTNRLTYLILQNDSAGQTAAAQFKVANPNGRAMVYTSFNCSASGDTNDIISTVPYSQCVANKWLLTRNGQPIQYPSYPADYMVDVANPAYIAAAQANMKRLLSNPNFDLFCDNGFGQVKQMGGTSDQYPTDAALEAAYVTGMKALVATAHSLGRKVYWNVCSDTLSVIQSYAGCVDGIMLESFTDGGLGLSQQTPWDQAMLQAAGWCESVGKDVVVHTYNTSETGDVFALCTALLVANGHTFFTTSTNNYSTAPTGDLWWPEYQLAASLVSAVGPYTQTGSAYTRQFFDGAGAKHTVTVDFGSLTASIV